jgi:hypothetical protein
MAFDICLKVRALRVCLSEPWSAKSAACKGKVESEPSCLDQYGGSPVQFSRRITPVTPRKRYDATWESGRIHLLLDFIIKLLLGEVLATY